LITPSHAEKANLLANNGNLRVDQRGSLIEDRHGSFDRESAMSRKNRGLRKLFGEMVVPLAMFVFLAAYWWQAAGLSVNAVSFPLTLSIILVAMLLLQLMLSWREIRAAADYQHPAEANADQPVDRSRGLAAAQRVLMLAIAAGLFMYWRELGGTVVIYIFVLGTLVLLGERRWGILLLLPAGLAIVLSFLFKSVLRVRFPDGILALF
jgi:small-conductance mechanosensitive channel